MSHVKKLIALFLILSFAISFFTACQKKDVTKKAQVEGIKKPDSTTSSIDNKILSTSLILTQTTNENTSNFTKLKATTNSQKKLQLQ